MSMLIHPKNLHRNQSGLVAFMVVMIIMILLSLIVLAFARLVRREQRQTADRQLSTQAFYAAETGVNDAREALRNAAATNPALLTNDYSTDCDAFITDAGLTNTVDPGISYSCILVDTTLPVLDYPSVPLDRSVTVPIQSNGGSIGTLDITFEDQTIGKTAAVLTGCNGAAPASQLPGQLNANCQIGMLRVEYVQYAGPGVPAPVGRTELTTTHRAAAFVRPVQTSGILNLPFASATANNQGIVHPADCTVVATRDYRCTVRITGLNTSQGYLRLRSIYKTTKVRIRALSLAGTSIDLVGAQAELDVTGRATDVLRRIKVGLPISASGDRDPEFALQSAQGICKRLTLSPTTIDVVWFPGLPGYTECHPQQ
jgi:Tfp pilus assembly protein PilX